MLNTKPTVLLHQVEDEVNNQFLDKEFQSGRVILKEGSFQVDKLNYHLYLNCICYYNEMDEPSILDNLSNVLIVTYGHRTFVPISSDRIAEVIKTFPDGSRLLFERQAKAQRESDDKGVFGTSTITASTTKASSGIISGQTVKFDGSQDIKYSFSERYIIAKGGKNYAITTLRSLRRVYRSQWDEIQKFADEHKTNLRLGKDVIELLEFITKK
jgi:hypothetical protein